MAFAREGAEVVAVDIDAQIESVPYGTARAADLAETVAQVQALDRRIVARTADVRDGAAIAAAVAEGLATFGHVDALVANAGIFSQAPFREMEEQLFRDVLEVDLLGVWRRPGDPHRRRAPGPARLRPRAGAARVRPALICARPRIRPLHLRGSAPCTSADLHGALSRTCPGRVRSRPGVRAGPGRGQRRGSAAAVGW